MKKLLHFLTLVYVFTSCQNARPPQEAGPLDTFSREMQELQNYFQIPGMALMVRQGEQNLWEAYRGWADVEKKIPVDSATLFPLASLTKMYSGVLLKMLEEEGKLKLEHTIKQYVPKAPIGDSILLKHVASHTSQGQVGEEFYYSSRFSWLSPVLEQAGGKKLEDLLQEKILQKAGLSQTFVLRDSQHVAQWPYVLAQPYLYEGKTQAGFVDYGYSTAAGLVATLPDFNRFTQALSKGKLISPAAYEDMIRPFSDKVPYGMGVFSQTYQGIGLVWAYGQYDCYSSLYLHVPEKDLSLILLANNALMSDPARLIYGDISSSLFALSFLKNWVLGQETMPLFEKARAQEKDYAQEAPLYRDKLRAEALAQAFMSRFDTSAYFRSAQLLDTLFARFPKYTEYGDLHVMHTLNFLNTVAFHREVPPLERFGPLLPEIGEALLSQDPHNPYTLLYMGSYYDGQGELEKAYPYFQRIVGASNFSRFWYTQEAENWIKKHAEVF